MGTCYQERNYLCTGLPANFWVYKLQRKNAPNCIGRIAEYRSRVHNHRSWCTARVLTGETAAKRKDNNEMSNDGRPSAHLTGNSKSEHVVEDKFMQPNVEWHAVYWPRRIQQTFISMIWSDDDNDQAALPQKASHFCLQSCKLLRTNTSLGRGPERKNMLAVLHMRVAIRPNSHSRDFANSSRKIWKLLHVFAFLFYFSV